MQIKKHILDNGLEVYFFPDHSKHNVEVNLVVKFGGLNKEFVVDGKRVCLNDGMAHLLEHYTLEASEYGLLMQEFYKYYMRSNGYTNKFYTLYYFDAVKYIDEGLELLIKGIHSPVFTEERLDFIKNAIREEIRMSQDSRSRRLLELETSQLFKNLSFRSVIGTISEIDSVMLDTVKCIFKTLYIPKNEMIFISGNVKEEEILQKIKQFYSELEFENHDIQPIMIEEAKEVSKKKDILFFPVAEPIYELTFKIYVGNLSSVEKDKLFYYLKIFCNANFSRMSKTCAQLKQERVIKRGIDITNSIFPNYFLLSIGAFTNHKERLKEVILDKMNQRQFNEDDYHLLLNENKVNAVLMEEQLSNTMDNFINNIFFLNYEHVDDSDFFDTLSFEEYQSFINDLDFSNYIETEVIYFFFIYKANTICINIP